MSTEQQPSNQALAERVHMQFPSQDAYEAAVRLDSLRWASTFVASGAMSGAGLRTVERGIVWLTNPERGNPQDVLMGTGLALDEMLTMYEQQQAVGLAKLIFGPDTQLKVVSVGGDDAEFLKAVADTDCGDPNCPVHGKQQKQPDPNDLDTAFGIGEFEL